MPRTPLQRDEDPPILLALLPTRRHGEDLPRLLVVFFIVPCYFTRGGSDLRVRRVSCFVWYFLFLFLISGVFFFWFVLYSVFYFLFSFVFFSYILFFLSSHFDSGMGCFAYFVCLCLFILAGLAALWSPLHENMRVYLYRGALRGREGGGGGN